ncbi:hypothetical protein [Halegenticoccus tardaugens]|uniref:hypothetical protein n=1 Tax=Halegenticoccus tardaugens TaxID=2071624 RepID=UPI00100AA5D3|nr:hypothetical protein [Halegenticoccus tardaugens]
MARGSAGLSEDPPYGAVEEWKSFRVDVSSWEDSEPVHLRLTTVVASRLDDWGLNATAVWTGVPMRVAAAVVGRGDALSTGAKPPEEALAPDPFVDELAERNIVIEERRLA